ncbi:hypothetical protein ACO22_07470 [Paracoccidioides brasiliensis]|uniref:Uncharacterized protein n=1 Tax=Paracoccidioides brasiliensis TaxID=121759 RepID=A0A1D2J4L0_PARBR|nr:hypothetical protein ACO22_07470 [Paracoccidioides brasiliensis]
MSKVELDLELSKYDAPAGGLWRTRKPVRVLLVELINGMDGKIACEGWSELDEIRGFRGGVEIENIGDRYGRSNRAEQSRASHTGQSKKPGEDSTGQDRLPAACLVAVMLCWELLRRASVIGSVSVGADTSLLRPLRLQGWQHGEQMWLAGQVTAIGLPPCAGM